MPCLCDKTVYVSRSDTGVLQHCLVCATKPCMCPEVTRLTTLLCFCFCHKTVHVAKCDTGVLRHCLFFSATRPYSQQLHRGLTTLPCFCHRSMCPTVTQVSYGISLFLPQDHVANIALFLSQDYVANSNTDVLRHCLILTQGRACGQT